MKFLRDVKNIQGKVALVRVDFNVNDTKSLRLIRTLPSLEFLKKRKASMVLVSHKGKPLRRVESRLSLKFLKPFLEKSLGKKVEFLEDFDFLKMRKKIRSAEPGSIFLMENIRFLPGEKANSPDLAHQLAGLADFYVNDAFADSHREHASIVSVASFLPHCAGLLLEEELERLGGALRRPKQPLVLLLAGGKARDKFSVIEKLYPRVGHILLGGVLANSFLRASGMHIHPSVVEGELIEVIQKDWLKKKKILLPQDFVKDVYGRVLDIGPKTIKEYSKIIKKAGSIIWGGPLGMFEDPRYRKGSEAMARAVAGAKAKSLVGGGETTSLILDMGLEKKIDFLSTGGGAMLRFLAGEKLPGVEALKK